MKSLMRWMAVFLTIVMVMSACSSRDDAAEVTAPAATAVPEVEEAAPEPTAVTETTEEEPMEEEPMEEEPMEEEPMEEVIEEALMATDVGVSETEIRIGVIADIDTPIAPGLSQTIHDGALAWAESVNARGGVAGRQIVMTTYDSKLNPNEATNAVIDACQNEFALVGAGMFTLLNPAPLIECADINGDATGLPDFASLSVSPGQGASPVTFPVYVNGQVFTAEEPTYVMSMAGMDFAESQLDGAQPKILVLEPGAPGIRPSAVAISQGLVEERGYESAGVITYLDGASQSEAIPIINTIREQDVNIVYSIAGGVGLVMAEAVLQGLDVDSISWVCTAQCFSPFFANTFGETSEGLIATMNTLPYTDAGQESVDEYLSGIDPERVGQNGVTAYGSGKAFEEIMATIVDTHGINGITRANVLDLLRSQPEVSAGGILGPGSVLGQNSECAVALQLIGGEWVRVDPVEVGEFKCSPTGLITVVNPTE